MNFLLIEIKIKETSNIKMFLNVAELILIWLMFSKLSVSGCCCSNKIRAAVVEHLLLTNTSAAS